MKAGEEEIIFSYLLGCDQKELLPIKTSYVWWLQKQMSKGGFSVPMHAIDKDIISDQHRHKDMVV